MGAHGKGRKTFDAYPTPFYRWGMHCAGKGTPTRKTYRPNVLTCNYRVCTVHTDMSMIACLFDDVYTIATQV